jgi:Spy/CpxP family protein refolding chaperone
MNSFSSSRLVGVLAGLTTTVVSSVAFAQGATIAPTPSLTQSHAVRSQPVTSTSQGPRRAIILVVGLPDSLGGLVAGAVRSRLASDTSGRPLWVIPQKDIHANLRLAGYERISQLSQADMRQLANFVRADILLSLSVEQSSGVLRVRASLVDKTDEVPHDLARDIVGSVDLVSDQVVQALRQDSTYLRISRREPARTAFAQNATIQGTVRSSQGQALRAANVRIPDLNISYGTAEDGTYRITLPADRVRGQTVTMTVRAIGFRPQSRQITISAGMQDHDFTLEFDVNRVSEVIVSGQGAKETKTLAFTVDKAGNVSGPATGDFSQHLYAPELIMQNQGRLRITESQREAILQEISKVQATATQVQWRVSEESEKLNQLLERENVQESEVLAQADRLMNGETAVKRAQLSMLIRIRNLLTPEQRSMLRAMRRRE